jgi:hypothetical protein
MSSQLSVNLLIECRPSRRLSLLYAALFGAATLGILASDIPPVLQAVCCAALAFGAGAVLRRHILLLAPDSVVMVAFTSGQWTIHTRNGGGRPARLESAAFWLFDIIPLVFECGDDRRYTALLTPDGAGTESLRELRSWIRHRLPAA